MHLFPPSLPRLPLSPLGAQLGKQVRAQFRVNASSQPTAQLAPNLVQANLVVLERKYALDFALFAMNNSQACPLLDIVSSSTESVRLAPGSDLRRDLPRYRVWKQGRVVSEPEDVVEHWPPIGDGVAFLIGCSFSFDALLRPYVHSFSAQCESVPMYRTQVSTAPDGGGGGGSSIFNGSSNLVCSMRLVPRQHVARVVQLTSAVPLAHGAPIAVGRQEAIHKLGVHNLAQPDFGIAPPASLLEEEEEDGQVVPMFWACGVTPQLAIEAAGIDAITHAPGCMFVTDVNVKDL